MKIANRLASCLLAVALGFLALNVLSESSRPAAAQPSPLTIAQAVVPCCCKATFTVAAAGANCNCGIAVSNLQVSSLHCSPYAAVGGSCEEYSVNSCTATGKWAETGCGYSPWTDFSLEVDDCGDADATDTKACSSGTDEHEVKLNCNNFCIPFDCE